MTTPKLNPKRATRGAPTGNRNAAKPARERADAIIQLRVREGDKRRWQRAADAVGQPLSQWIVQRLPTA